METQDVRHVDALDPLVGRWSMVASIGGQPVAGAQITFEWMADGPFLRQTGVAEPPRPETPPTWVENSPFPTVAIIGKDDGSGRYRYLHADARGVRRCYDMTVGDDRWTLTGTTENGYHQRLTAVFGDAGDAMTARWESSTDGERWHHDFDETYVRVARR